MSVWGTVVKEWADRNAMLGADSVEIEVPIVNFTHLFSEYGCPYYLKIDIEGMDLVCLRKLFLSDFRPRFVSIESEKIDFPALIEEFDVFQMLGYKKFFVRQQANISANLVPSNTQEGPYIDFKFSRGSSGLFGSDLGRDWKSRDEAISKYQQVFNEYRHFGDNSFIRRMPFGKYMLYAVSKIIRRPLPGWYDTHAALG